MEKSSSLSLAFESQGNVQLLNEGMEGGRTLSWVKWEWGACRGNQGQGRGRQVLWWSGLGSLLHLWERGEEEAREGGSGDGRRW